MTHYEEKQIFKLRWIIFPIALFPLIIMLTEAKGSDALLGISILGGTMLLSGLLLFSMRQTIRINIEGVQYKQSPFHRTFRTVPWTTIQEWRISKLNAIGDFGGWGIRITRKKKGYIIDGEYALELKTEDKKLLVLSVINKKEVQEAMEQFGQYV